MGLSIMILVTDILLSNFMAYTDVLVYIYARLVFIRIWNFHTREDSDNLSLCSCCSKFFLTIFRSDHFSFSFPTN